MDRYSKVVLTVIAISLSVIAVENLPTVHAAVKNVQYVKICGDQTLPGEDPPCADIKGGALVVTSR